VPKVRRCSGTTWSSTTSKVASLRRYKDDAKEVRPDPRLPASGVENFNDIKVGDILETYSVEEIQAAAGGRLRGRPNDV